LKTLTFQISDEAFELFIQVNKHPHEFRDPEWPSLDDFKKSSEYLNGIRTEEWFLNRNSNGTLYLINELEYYGLVECDGMSWHITYVPTIFGSKLFKEIQRDIKLEKLGI
jgi:hypothetical protein